MTREQFVQRNFHEFFGIVCEAWLANHDTGATFSKDIRSKQGRVAELLGEFYDQLTPPAAPPPKDPPKATPAAGTTQPRK